MFERRGFVVRSLIVTAVASGLASACGNGGAGDASNQVVLEKDAGEREKDAGERTDGGCATPFTQCGDDCVDVLTDVSNCGACGNACAAGLVCSHGSCNEACDTGLTDCAGSCVDLQTTVDHCGSCEIVCEFAEATAECRDAACNMGTCNTGYGDCNADPSDGCETPLSSPQNCGACGHVCATPANGTAGCVPDDQTFTCAIASCRGSQANCDNDPANGCETNTSTDANHCGACGNACLYANANAVCSNGRCWMGSCWSGFMNCDMNTQNGCEVNTNEDVNHCGSCGRVCSVENGTAGCANGVCTVAACNSGFGNCDNRYANGCETRLSTSTDNCGSCGNACATPTHGTRTCADGICGISCNTGYADCDGLAQNGCEANKNTDVDHCGACANACAIPANGTRTCTNGLCGFTCNSGFRSCDNDSANGCEADLNTTASNCGSCGRVCSVENGTAGCANGVCTVAACNSGFGNCDNYVSNGCETNLNTNTSHCGACGNACATHAHGTPTCTDGVCGFSCQQRFENCDNDLANGCEIGTYSDVDHCGSCTNVCAIPANGSRTCSNGSCGLSCQWPHRDCDGVAATGCESNIENDSNNCGACGTQCATGTGCFGYNCRPNGYAFGACKTQGCSATLYSSCGTNMADFRSTNTVTSATLQGCLGFPALSNGAHVAISFDYAASASSCWDRPSLAVYSNDNWLTASSFPDCTSAGSMSLDFTLPADQNTFSLRVFAGDWCASVRVTSVTQL